VKGRYRTATVKEAAGVRVLLCGGGTGGHIYPALAVADELNSRVRSLDALYVGAEGEIEETVVPRSNIPLERLSGGGLHGVGLGHFARNLAHLGQGFVQSWRILGRFRPDVTFLTGGYVSVPVALAVWLKRRPILVYLPDVEPGRAVKLLSRIATQVAVTVEASQQYLRPKVVVTGYPLRSEFRQDQTELRKVGRLCLSIPAGEKVLLVFGGSRGARSINQALGTIMERVLALAHVIHISGTLDAEQCRARTEMLPADLRTRYHLFDYVHEMAQTLATADLVVARAGAATLGEFPNFGLPAILVPYPYAWRYQRVNADYLAERGAAVRLNDEEMGQRLWPTIESLLGDDERLEEMSKSARALAQPDAAARLADLLGDLAETS
jgi:UDP-N-acetylglucosamine--N-acetylmuramyl-(pentapeptide) pyrophosphoryl-undecaprenol N-acetylglucosamine transferase